MFTHGFTIKAVDDIDDNIEDQYYVDGMQEDRQNIQLTQGYIRDNINDKYSMSDDIIKLIYRYWRTYVVYTLYPQEIYTNNHYNIEFKLVDAINPTNVLGIFT